MDYTITPARKIIGEVRVPGELEPAVQALVLGALAEGESELRHLPPAVGPLAAVLEELGVRILRSPEAWQVQGVGLKGFRPAGGTLELAALGEASLLLLGLLAGQRFATRVVLEGEDPRSRELLAMVSAMGGPVAQESESVVVIGGSDGLIGVAHEAVDLDPTVKLAVLLAGLGATGVTSLVESAGKRNRLERLLRQRQVMVERRRQDDGNRYQVGMEGGQPLQASTFELAGDLQLAYPLMAVPLLRKGSVLKIRQVAIRPATRGTLDLLRQLGGEVQIDETGNETADLTVSFSRNLKPTRLAGQRAAKVLAQIPLLSVLATQLAGEFVIRDIETLRLGPFDQVAYLFELLKKAGARVGEYPEGLVVKGITPLQGTRIDSRGDPALAMAFGVAGLLAESEMVIEGAECVKPIYPDFFTTLDALKRS